MIKIATTIQLGAMSFLMAEYLYMASAPRQDVNAFSRGPLLL